MSALLCSALHRPLQFPSPPTLHPHISSCYKVNPRHTPAGCHLTPTLEGPEREAAGRMCLSSNVLVYCLHAAGHSTNPLCLCTVWPGSILAEQGMPEGVVFCWEHVLLLRELGGRSRAKFIIWILQKQLYLAPGRSQTWPRSCWLLQLLIGSQAILCRHCPCLAPAMTQLHANSINPHTEPLLFWVLFVAPVLFFSKTNLPSTKKYIFVGTLCEKWLFLYPSINTGAKKTQ